LKVVILAGGLGTRLSEETAIKPKPMVEIGDEPILWHIMKIYYAQGLRDFIICAGYKQQMIKDYFVNYVHNHVDIEIDLKDNKVNILSEHLEDWSVKVIDTGKFTMTGGRIKRISRYVGNEPFMLTYGDGSANIDLRSLLKTHSLSRHFVTVTAVQPKGRFGSLSIDEKDRVVKFQEKPPGDGYWINGGFYVMEPDVFDYIEGDGTVWEGEPMMRLTEEGQVVAFRHTGFWMAMDTMNDKRNLENLWNSGNAPWKIWDG
jgi:glucose-1-phosphate cytidylyltransferase